MFDLFVIIPIFGRDQHAATTPLALVISLLVEQMTQKLKLVSGSV